MWSNHAGVQPLGNALLEVGGLTAWSAKRSRSLGSLARLSDELLCKVVIMLEPADLARLSQVSVGCRAFAMDEDLWRPAVFNRFNTAFTFKDSWRTTYIVNHMHQAEEGNTNAERVGHSLFTPFYSDFLFQKYRCMYSCVQPKWCIRQNIRREDALTLSQSRFREQYEEPGRPVVITGVVNTWDAYRKWSPDALVAKYKDTKFHVAGYEYTLGDYCHYLLSVQQYDDQVMLLFDKHFGEKVPEMAADYETPKYFSEDLFSVFGKEKRPDYRWLIVGPERSGSQWHIDPNCTSAWNAVILGRKKWILFPPNVTPPGVMPSEDGSEVHAPVSVMEWFLNFYEPASEMGKSVGAIECVVGQGEMIFIPAGWWHVVLNLDFSVAVTQNYVSSSNVVDVAQWLHDRPEQISGCKSLANKQFVRENFVRLVAEKHPELRDKLKAGGFYCADSPAGKGGAGNSKALNKEGKKDTGNVKVTKIEGNEGAGIIKVAKDEGSQESGNTKVAKNGRDEEDEKRVCGEPSAKKQRTDLEAKEVDTSPTEGINESVKPVPKQQRMGIWESLRQETAPVEHGDGKATQNGEKKEGDESVSMRKEGSSDGKPASREGFRFDFNIGG